MKNPGANDLLRLRLKARDLEEERHDLPGTVETYGKAAAMGDPVAVREILKKGEENAAARTSAAIRLFRNRNSAR